VSRGEGTAQADARYRPPPGAAAWAAAPVDRDGWAAGVAGVARLRATAPAWFGWAERRCLLAAAWTAGGADGLYAGDASVVPRLLAGQVSTADLPGGAHAHVLALAGAMAAAGAQPGFPAEAAIARLHALACAPQATHAVDGGADHHLAHGDHKHHPNHARRPDGSWRAHAPVAGLEGAVAAFTAEVASPAVAGLHPLARAGFVLLGLAHIAPFADGNERVGRVLAGAELARAGGLPLVAGPLPLDPPDPAALAAALGAAAAAAVDALERLAAGAGPGGPVPPAGWLAQEGAARAVRARLGGALAAAVRRHAGRPAVGWQDDLGTAAVQGPSATVAAGGATVAEHLVVHAHPLGRDAAVVVEATGAGLELEVAAGEDPGERLDGWLDQVVAALAVRAAAAGGPN